MLGRGILTGLDACSLLLIGNELAKLRLVLVVKIAQISCLEGGNVGIHIRYIGGTSRGILL